jgi:integrase
MGELLALRWRDVDFALRAIQVRASYTHRQLDTPKNRTGRTVPMIDAVATALAQLEQREYFTRPDDLVFASAVGSHLDDSALRRRYKRARHAAGLRPLRFHDLCHTFGTHAIRTVDPRELQDDGPRRLRDDADLSVVQAPSGGGRASRSGVRDCAHARDRKRQQRRVSGRRRNHPAPLVRSASGAIAFSDYASELT